MQNIYEYDKYQIKDAIKRISNTKLKEGCELLSKRTGIPAYTFYTFSQGAWSKRYSPFMLAYLVKYGALDIDKLFRIQEIQKQI